VVFTGSGQGRLMVILRGLGSVFLSPKAPEGSMPGQASERIASYLAQHGASFFGDIREGSGLSLRALNSGLAELFWAGMVTNDRFSELSRIGRPTRLDQDEPLEPVRPAFPGRHPARQRMVQSVRRALRQVPGWSGRWSLVRTPGVLGKERSLEEQISGQAAQLLERYGIVARELIRRETLLPWSLLALEFQRMELRGEIRRGYFVNGLAGMQYALPDALEALRRQDSAAAIQEGPLLLNACDPASPYGPGIDPPLERGRDIRITRSPSNYLVTAMGVPEVWIEAYGSRIWTLTERADQALREALGGLRELLRAVPDARPVRVLSVQLIDGERATESRYERLFREAGFQRGPGQSLLWDGFP
jgi:ATP-dependent Lhr-like helicase